MFTVRSVVALLSLTTLIVACADIPDLPPEEVIRRAVIKSNTVESVAVALSVDLRTITTNTLSGSMIVQGILRSGSQAWSADTSFNVESTMKRGHERASGRLQAVSPGRGQTYLRLESIDGALGDLVKKSLTGSMNTWMVYGTDAGTTPSLRHTPDPALLSSYADAIVVTENLGNVRDAAGRTLYHYRVALKPETVSSLPQGGSVEEVDTLKASGELWIESTSFSLARALWFLTNVPTVAGPVTLNIDAIFSDYNAAPHITSPTGSASILPLESIFAIFSS